MDTPYRNLAVDRVLGVLRAADIEAEVSVPGRSPTASAGEPYFDFIDLSLSQGRNAKAIYQDLVDDRGFTGPLPECQTLCPPVARPSRKPLPSPQLRSECSRRHSLVRKGRRELDHLELALSQVHDGRLRRASSEGIVAPT